MTNNQVAHSSHAMICPSSTFKPLPSLFIRFSNPSQRVKTTNALHDDEAAHSYGQDAAFPHSGKQQGQ